MEFPNFPFSGQISHSDVLYWLRNSPAREVVNLANPYTGPSCPGSIFATFGTFAAQAGDSASFAQQSEASPNYSVAIGVSAGCVILAVIIIVVVVLVYRKKQSKLEESV